MTEMVARLTNPQAKALKSYVNGRPGARLLTLAVLKQKIKGTEAKAVAETFGGMSIAWGALTLASLAASPIGGPLLILAAAGTALAVKGLLTKNRGEQAGLALHAMQAANEASREQKTSDNPDATTHLSLIAEDSRGRVAVLSSQNKTPNSHKRIGGMRLGNA